MLGLNHIFNIVPGERLKLTNEHEMLLVEQGRCELYVEDKKTGRQVFLMEVDKNEAIFPIENDELTSFVYVLEDMQMRSVSAVNYPREVYGPYLRTWHQKLLQVPFIKLEILRNRELNEYWDRVRTQLPTMSQDDLLVFGGKTQLALLQQLRSYFDRQQAAKEDRVEHVEEYHQRLVDSSINHLLNRDTLVHSEEEGQQHEQIAFLVRAVAKSLLMPTDNIKLSMDLASKLDQLGLIKRLVQKGNMNMRLVTLDKDWYHMDCGVLLGFWGDDKELVALLPQNEKSYHMITYENPKGIPVDEQVAAHIDKDGFQCYAGFPARKLTIRDLLLFMFQRSWKRDYYTILLCSMIAGMIPLVSPIITETIFSDIIPIRDYVGLGAVTQIMMLTGFTTAALALVRSIAVLRITSHLDMSVEAALWGRLLQLPAKFFRRFESGELLQRMNCIESIKQMVSGEFVGQVFNFVFSFWSLGLMCWYSWKLTLQALAVWAVYMVIIFFVYRRIIGYQKEYLAASNKTAGLLQQIFSGLGKFRVHGAETQAYNRWAQTFGEEWKWKMKLRWQNNYSSILGVMQPAILTMLMYYTAMYGMTETTTTGQVVSHMSYSQFLAFQSAFSSFNATIVGIIPLAAQIFTIRPQIDNLRPILEELPEVTDDKLDADILTGDIKIEHLSFSYGDDLPDVLKDINLDIHAGEHIAIVGKSGCGKSTLLRLLLGMEVPKRGVIYYDHQDMQQLNLASIRSQLGVVLQNGQLMTGDIFTNIVGTTPLTMEDAWQAAEMAGIAQDIREMPMGMQTIISEGSGNISGGQRQRLLIARAIVGRPAIIMLDEATSALDNRTQSIVTESLSKMRATRIVIAHRLSTIKGADRIIMLDDGQVVEQGSFEELMRLDGKFAQMAKRQMA